jgi:hypothetical protein
MDVMSDRIDGRDLKPLIEPGSDALLLRGLLLAFAHREEETMRPDWVPTAVGLTLIVAVVILICVLFTLHLA